MHDRSGWVLCGALVMVLAGCGGSSSAVDAGADLPVEVATDLPTETGAEVEAADATDVSANDASPEAAEPDSKDVEEPADVPADVAPDAPPFQWAAGCEGTGTGAAWTPINDDTFLGGPLVQMSDRDTVTLLWRPAVASAEPGCVDLSWGDQSRTECGTADANGQYEVAVNGLPPATEIAYTVRIGDVRTAQMTFRTMPDRPVPMKIAVFADAHNNAENLRKMSALALAEGVDLAFSVGDQANAGLPEEYDQCFDGWRDLGARVNLWTVIGNHDEKNEPGYFESFALPHGNAEEESLGTAEGYWARRIGNTWIGGGWVRDFYFSMPDSDFGEVAWFRQQFESADFKTAQWRLFFIHQPAYVTQWGSTCDYDGEDCLKVAMIPLLAQAGVQATFHGHMHGIEWGAVEGVNTFVVGGVNGNMDDGICPTPEGFPSPWHSIYNIANFAIVETGCDALTVRYLDLEGNELQKIDVPASTPRN